MQIAVLEHQGSSVALFVESFFCLDAKPEDATAEGGEIIIRAFPRHQGTKTKKNT